MSLSQSFSSPLPSPVQEPPPGVTSDYADPIDEGRKRLYIITTVIFMLLSTLAFVARLYARLFIVKKFGWDDALVTISVGINAGLTASFVAQWDVGLTFIAWNVSFDDFSAHDLNSWIYWNSVFTLLLYIVFPIIKLSILAFYLRVLGPGDRKYRIGVWTLIAFVVATLVATVASVLQMCRPVIGLFHPYIPATCNISASIFIAQAALMVLTDLFCLLPPIPFVWKLHTSTSQKVGILLPILIGLGVTALGLVRMALLIEQLDAPSYAIDLESWEGTYLAIIEINCALIAVCLPALSPLFKRAIETVTGSAKRPSVARYVHNSSGRTPRNKRSYTNQLDDALLTESESSCDSGEQQQYPKKQNFSKPTYVELGSFPTSR